MVHAGYAAKRMCLREFNQAMNNMPTGKFPPGKGPVRGGGLNLSQVRPTISCGCPHILFAVFLGGQGAVRMSAFRASRYTCSARTHVRKIQVSAKSPAGLAGPLPALATVGSGGRCLFFCARSTQLWLLQQRAWGRKCWGRWNARTALSSRIFFHKIAEIEASPASLEESYPHFPPLRGKSECKTMQSSRFNCNAGKSRIDCENAFKFVFMRLWCSGSTTASQACL
jgi:hypothetical protein